MTEEQLEIAARKYCELTGMNPDSHAPDPCNITMGWKTFPRWVAVAYEILSHHKMMEAIEYAKRQTDLLQSSITEK